MNQEREENEEIDDDDGEELDIVGLIRAGLLIAACIAAFVYAWGWNRCRVKAGIVGGTSHYSWSGGCQVRGSHTWQPGG